MSSGNDDINDDSTILYTTFMFMYYHTSRIEELFAGLKAFIQRHWQSYEDNPDQGFNMLLKWCVDTVGRRKQNAEGNFHNSGLNIENI